MFSVTIVVLCQAGALRLVVQHISARGINKGVSFLDKFIASVILHVKLDVLFFSTPSSGLTLVTYFGVLKGVVPLLRDLGQLVQESQDRLVSTPRTSDPGHGDVTRFSRIHCVARSA